MYHQIFAFLTIAVILTLTPGPDNMMVLSISLSKGRRYGTIFGAGCALGCLNHTLMAMAGVSALIVTSSHALTFLKLFGGAYLLYLGLKLILSKNTGGSCGSTFSDHLSMRETFFQGFLASSINPKVALFFLSFLPQFVVPDEGNIAVQLGILGSFFMFQAIIIFSLIAYFSGSIANFLNHHFKMGVWLDRVAGCTFVLLAMRMWGNV